MAAYNQEEARIALNIVENSPSVALRVSEENGGWKTLFISRNISEYGYSRQAFISGEVNWRQLVHPEDLPVLCQKLAGYAARGIDKFTVTYRIVKKSGEVVWVADSTTVERDENGRVLYTDCVIADHTRIVTNQRQQAVMNEMLQSLQKGEPEEAFQVILDRTGQFLGLSRVLLFEDNAEHSQCQAVYEWAADNVPRLSADGEFYIDYRRQLPEVDTALQEYGYRVVNAGQVPAGCQAEFAREGVLASAIYSVYLSGERYGFICFDECQQQRRWDGDTLAFLKNVAKLTDTALMRKANEESIRRIAYRDQLTGLTNRYRFDYYLEQAMRQASLAKRNGYVMLLDMDDFKVINEGYGHDYGDELLQTLAAYLKENFGSTSHIFRFGGDEFVILLEHENAHYMQEIADKCLQRAQHPWVVRDREFYCTLSIGVVRFPDGEADAKGITRNADIALYQAKSQGKNNYVLYNESLHNDSVQRVETENKMRDAIENAFSGFRLHYQPIVDLAGQVCGAEALVRWVDAEGNMMSPGEFIPLAEYLGLIVPLGEFVLREAATECRRINQWMPHFTMSVNVSIRQFQQSDFIPRVESILREVGVEFSNIILEVTEGMLVRDMEHMRMMAEQLRGLGLHMAMDDFGTGYSSLNNMRQLPLDVIKIDRIFIRDVIDDSYAQNFIRLISELTHSMGRQVCVEGVETAAQYSYCAECGVDRIQGYYFYRPMPAKQLRAELQRAEQLSQMSV